MAYNSQTAAEVAEIKKQIKRIKKGLREGPYGLSLGPKAIGALAWLVWRYGISKRPEARLKLQKSKLSKLLEVEHKYLERLQATYQEIVREENLMKYDQPFNPNTGMQDDQDYLGLINFIDRRMVENLHIREMNRFINKSIPCGYSLRTQTRRFYFTLTPQKGAGEKPMLFPPKHILFVMKETLLEVNPDLTLDQCAGIIAEVLQACGFDANQNSIDTEIKGSYDYTFENIGE